MARSLKIRSRIRLELVELLWNSDRPAFQVLAKLKCSRKTSAKVLQDEGGYVYHYEGIWWWSIKPERKLNVVRKKLETATRKGDIRIDEALSFGSERVVRKAAKELGLVIKRVGRTGYWARSVVE